MSEQLTRVLSETSAKVADIAIGAWEAIKKTPPEQQREMLWAALRQMHHPNPHVRLSSIFIIDAALRVALQSENMLEAIRLSADETVKDTKEALKL